MADQYEDPLKGLFLPEPDDETTRVGPVGFAKKGVSLVPQGLEWLNENFNPAVGAYDAGQLLADSYLNKDYSTGGRAAMGGLGLATLLGSVPGVPRVPRLRKQGAFKDAPVQADDVIKKGYRTGVMYPRIYADPSKLVEEANSRFVPETGSLNRVLGMKGGRHELDDINKAGTRQGHTPIDEIVNVTRDRKTGEIGAGNKAVAEGLTTNKNMQRILDLLGMGDQMAPDLMLGMRNWYAMDPLYDEFVKEFGEELAPAMYNRFQANTGMFSPGAPVPVELHRGTAALYAGANDMAPEFLAIGGKPQHTLGKKRSNFADVQGHPYHSTSQAKVWDKWLQNNPFPDPDNMMGAMNNLRFMGSPKVPAYIAAAGVPHNTKVPWQLEAPVPDAHFSRLIGMPDVRTIKPDDRGKSASLAEFQAILPWWSELSKQRGQNAVSNQAQVWGLGSWATGVESPLGQPKLEMLTDMVEQTAARTGRQPRDILIDLMYGRSYLDAPPSGG